eukprot:gb/GFBE01009093.1/.p1 GENE.gb/GFBE01009093.1/~~gb/GFBE01009093.1/.p1  ORF type:complete len:887 (+),score=255.19 gb/GFBE01009093.1/:1-2661(+)
MAALPLTQIREKRMETVEEHLASDLPSSRCAALREIARKGSRLAKMEIGRKVLPMLDDKDASVQVQALAVLGDVGSTWAAEYATLIVKKLNTSSEKEVKQAALVALGNLGPAAASQAVAAVEPFLNHQDLDFVADACVALGKLAAESLADALASKLCSSDAAVLAAACTGLAAMDRQPQAVAELLAHAEPLARAGAVRALKNMTGAEECVLQVAPLLRDSDGHVRIAVAEFAQTLGEKASGLAEVAGQLLDHQDPGVVAAAAIVLGSLGATAKTAIPALAQALRRGGEDRTALSLAVAGVSPKLAAEFRKPACAAAAALGAMGEDGADAAADIAECLNSEDWEIRAAALNALGRMPSSSARFETEIVERLCDEFAPVISEACATLGALAEATGWPSSATAQAVAEVLSHPSPSVKVRALQSLSMMGEESYEYAESYINLFRDPAHNVQVAAIQAVSKCGDLGTMYSPDVCRMTFPERATAVRVAACEALGRMGQRGAAFEEEVEQLLRDADADVRSAAKSTLELFRAGGHDKMLQNSQEKPAVEDAPVPQPEPPAQEDKVEKRASVHFEDMPAPKLPVGLLFPGQGSQYVKMMNDVKDLPAVKEMLEKAKGVLGYDLLELCLQGPEEKLEQTKFCQPAVYVAGLAGAELLKKEKGAEAVEQAQAVAGLSLGEYTALTVAGVFDFETGLKLVKLRAEAMQEAAEASEQLMVSVAGLDKATLDKLCNDARTGPDDICQVANFLFPNGFSCAGSKAAIEKLQKTALDTPGCLQCKVLKTSGAFHTKFMAPARERLVLALKEAEAHLQPPRCDVYMNLTGKKLRAGTPPSEVVDMLGDQLCGCVLWEPSMKAMMAGGITQFYECGPAKQLKAMMKRISSESWKNTTNIHV